MDTTLDDFDKNVFLNCPFDPDYDEIFKSIIFTIIDCGFIPHTAFEESNANISRLERIMAIILKCRFGIHDISRTTLDDNQLPRFNMPFELGLDIGCSKFGEANCRRKVSLILDTEKFRYQKFISDIGGQDIKDHDAQVGKAIKAVRNWFNRYKNRVISIPTGVQICDRFLQFSNDLPLICANRKWEIDQLDYIDLANIMAGWIVERPF